MVLNVVDSIFVGYRHLKFDGIAILCLETIRSTEIDCLHCYVLRRNLGRFRGIRGGGGGI